MLWIRYLSREAFPAPIILKHLLKIKLINTLEASLFHLQFHSTLMVHAINFGLVMLNVSLVCFVNVFLQYSWYSLYTIKIVLFCSLIFMLLNKPLYFALTLHLLLRFVNRQRVLLILGDLWEAGQSKKELQFYFPFNLSHLSDESWI